LISFELTEEQKLAQSMLQDLATNALRPAARAADEGEAISPRTLSEIWATGIIQARTDADAPARTCITNAIALEELAFADASFAMSVAAPLGFLSVVAAQGSVAQKKNLLPLFAGDEYRSASIAISEPDFAFDVSAISTRATRNGNSYRLNGEKGPVPLASQSSHFLVIANCEDKREAFIVDRNAPGISVRKKPGIGLRALEMATVDFKDVELGADARLGESAGCDVQQIVDAARVALAAIMCGTSRAIMEFVIPYTKERVVHGAPLAQKQVIAFRLADMRIETDAMRWMVWKAASILEKGKEAAREAQLAYTYAGEQAMWIADEGVQMLGGHGYLRDNPVEMWYRDIRTLSVLEGAVGV